jgi:hypothetical protein
MRKCIKYMTLAVALLLGVVSAQEATAPATGVWGGVPSYASPAAQAKVNNKFASQFGIDTSSLGISPEAYIGQATGAGVFGGSAATPAASADASTGTPASTTVGSGFMGGIPSYASPAAQASVNNKMASQFGIDSTAGWGAGAFGGQGLSLLAVANTAAPTPSALQTAASATT